MKIYVSNFYQIRYFTPNMVPLSTCHFDQPWFHDFTNDETHVFKNKSDVICGLKIPLLMTKDTSCRGMPCQWDPYECNFLMNYEKQLDCIDFYSFIESMKDLEKKLQQEFDIKEEIIFVLIVYEAKQNACSERTVLKKWFRKNGKKLKEWEHEK